jgi:hypothetical protein
MGKDSQRLRGFIKNNRDTLIFAITKMSIQFYNGQMMPMARSWAHFENPGADAINCPADALGRWKNSEDAKVDLRSRGKGVVADFVRVRGCSVCLINLCVNDWFGG